MAWRRRKKVGGGKSETREEEEVRWKKGIEGLWQSSEPPWITITMMVVTASLAGWSYAYSKSDDAPI